MSQPLTSKVDHKHNEWILQVNIELNSNRVTIITISREAKAIMHEQELVRPVSITVVSLLSRLERPPLKVDEAEVRFFVVLLRIIPVELLISFATDLAIFIFFSFELWLQWLHLPVPILISVKVSFIDFLVFCDPMEVVKHVKIIFDLSLIVKHNSLSTDKKLQAATPLYLFKHFLGSIDAHHRLEHIHHP